MMSNKLNDSWVEVQFIGDSIGKGLFATSDFKNGEVIFEEAPLVSCQFLWNFTYGYLACDLCMRPLETLEQNVRRLTAIPDITLPHPECCTTRDSKVLCSYCYTCYCSEKCRQTAWSQFHETLCVRSPTLEPSHPIVLLQETWKQMHYPPETASIMLLVRILATIKQATDKEKAISLFTQFCHRTINEEEEIAHKLLGAEFQSQLENLRNLMGRIFGTDEFLHHWLTPDGFRSLVALVGTNGQGIGASPLSEWVKNCDALQLADDHRIKLDRFIDDLYEKLDKESGTFLNTEGAGLYRLQSTCNHSCEPNAIVTFPHNNFELCVKALKNIKSGEEILLSYLDECILERSRHSRQKVLRENYLFSCDCSKCQIEAEEPDETSEEEMEDDSE